MTGVLMKREKKGIDIKKAFLVFSKDLWYSTGTSAQYHVAAWTGGEFGGNRYMNAYG